MITSLSERQEELVRACLDIIGSEGMGKLTVRNVARRVGFSEPALYRHFPDKTSLLEAILDYVSVRMERYFDEAHRAGPSGRPALDRFLRRMFEEFAEVPALVPLLFTDELLHQDERLAGRVQSTMERHLSRMSRLTLVMQKAGVWRSDIAADDLAVMILGTVRLSVVRLPSSGVPQENAAHLSSVLDRVLSPCVSIY